MKPRPATSSMSTLNSPPVITGLREWPPKPAPVFISSLDIKTCLAYGACSTSRNSRRGSLPCEHPSHVHHRSGLIRLHRGRSPFSLPGGHAFRLLHLPAVYSLHPR